MVGVEVCNDLESPVQGDNLPLDVLLQNSVSWPQYANMSVLTVHTHAISRMPISW